MAVSGIEPVSVDDLADVLESTGGVVLFEGDASNAPVSLSRPITDFDAIEITCASKTNIAGAGLQYFNNATIPVKYIKMGVQMQIPGVFDSQWQPFGFRFSNAQTIDQLAYQTHIVRVVGKSAAGGGAALS